MDELKAKVKELEGENGREGIIEKLQIIGAELLTKYEIRVNNITIEFLRVEPYFYKPYVFEDRFIHRDEGIYGLHQRNRFKKLYIHKGFSGVDIVLSEKDDYAFSFLIKNSRIMIDNKIECPFAKQYKVADILKKNGIPQDYDEIALYKKPKQNNSIVFKTIRNGLRKIAERPDFRKGEQNKYNELLVASFIELQEHTSSQYDFETGYGGDRAVVEYLKDYRAKHPNMTVDELDKMRKTLYPNGSKIEFEKYFKD